MSACLAVKLAASPQTSGEVMKNREGEVFLCADSCISTIKSLTLSKFKPGLSTLFPRFAPLSSVPVVNFQSLLAAEWSWSTCGHHKKSAIVLISSPQFHFFLTAICEFLFNFYLFLQIFSHFFIKLYVYFFAYKIDLFFCKISLIFSFVAEKFNR